MVIKTKLLGECFQHLAVTVQMVIVPSQESQKFTSLSRSGLWIYGHYFQGGEFITPNRPRFDTAFGN